MPSASVIFDTETCSLIAATQAAMIPARLIRFYSNKRETDSDNHFYLYFKVRYANTLKNTATCSATWKRPKVNESFSDIQSCLIHVRCLQHRETILHRCAINVRCLRHRGYIKLKQFFLSRHLRRNNSSKDHCGFISNNRETDSENQFYLYFKARYANTLENRML